MPRSDDPVWGYALGRGRRGTLILGAVLTLAFLLGFAILFWYRHAGTPDPLLAAAGEVFRPPIVFVSAVLGFVFAVRIRKYPPMR